MSCEEELEALEEKCADIAVAEAAITFKSAEITALENSLVTLNEEKDELQEEYNECNSGTGSGSGSS